MSEHQPCTPGVNIVQALDEMILEQTTRRTRLLPHRFAWRRWRRRGMVAAIPFGLALALVPQMFLLTAATNAAVISQEQAQSAKKEPLGSLDATGEVYVNDKPVPVESTVFRGDRVRTGAASTAIFTMTGNGTLKLGAQTQIVVSGEPEFAAELQSGTAVIDSISGPTGIKLRVGDFVVVPAVRSRVTSAKIEAQAGGTFQVTCQDGDISTLPLQGGAGQLLEAGQSVSIAPHGALVARKSPGVKSSGSAQQGPLAGRTGWTLLGVAGAGAGAAAIALTHHGGTPVSPSSP